MESDNKYVPALRFPEFKNDGEWKICKLSDIAKRKVTKNRQGLKLPVYTNSAIGGVVNQDEYFDREIVTKENIVNYGIVEHNDFVYNPRVSTAAPVGPISRNKLDRGIMSPLYLIFGFNKGDVNFYEYYFKSAHWHNYLKAKANYGARFDRINIATDDFMDMPMPYPNPREQKKIADCLFSLDSYIDATKCKLELLKDHKKGLMQRLFPAKGKTIPELRFPEFQDDGEWIPRPLSDILNYEQPTPYIVEDDTYKIEGTPVLTANKGFILGYTDESFGIYNKLPVIIFDDFTTDKKYVGSPFKIKSSAIKLLTLKDEERDNLRFVFECMNNIVFEEKEHKRYYISEYQHINIYVPSSLQEQNQIADTLLSVDKQISEYDIKIKGLEIHKKGLMQQLFPKL